MNTEKVSLLEHSKEVQRGNPERSEYLNLPDIDFFLFCERQYRVNKGVYNTIDRWFYQNGIENIIHRRIYLLGFLEFVTESNLKQNHHKYIRFGNGGLITKLQEFMKESESDKYII
ncbi:hypothetical protein R4Z09_28590 [Niallia oryzisoli]|uniref:LAGLIDADG homing endonuclease n=1 Tax=Niallia oryzisoli TaxID=1737571 RepID=A0ABZ2CBJ8_9BACI